MDLPGPIDNWARDAAESVLPGDNPVARITSIADGRSTLSPLYGPRRLFGAEVDAASGMDTDLCPGPTEAVCLGVKGTTNTLKAVDGAANFIGNDLPGGWGLVVAALLYLLYKILRGPSKAAAKAGKQAAKTAAVTYATVNYPGTAAALGITAKRSYSHGKHQARSGKTEFIFEDRSGAFEVCIDSGADLDRAVAARRRGWRLSRQRRSAPCPDNADKTHWSARKVK